MTAVTLSAAFIRAAFGCFPFAFPGFAGSNLKVVYMPMKGKDLIRLLERNGWALDRIQGSHHMMVKPGCRSVSVPVHGNKDMRKGTAAAIIRQAGLKEE